MILLPWIWLGWTGLQLDWRRCSQEFVHGDFGRTVPSLGSLLGCETDILQLDVIGLHEANDVEVTAQHSVEQRDVEL